MPLWPLSKASAAERRAWGEIWGLPHGAAWSQLRLSRTVARYVRVLVQAERPASHPVMLSEVRQLEDRLGLTPMSMLRLRWEIAPVPVEVSVETPAGVASLEDRRQRLSGA